MSEEYAPIDTSFKPSGKLVVQNESPQQKEKPTSEPPIISDESALEDLLKPQGKNDPSEDKNKYPEFYQVRKGDTLYSIARKFQISIDQLKSWNQLTSNVIRLGMRLRIQ